MFKAYFRCHSVLKESESETVELFAVHNKPDQGFPVLGVNKWEGPNTDWSNGSVVTGKMKFTVTNPKSFGVFVPGNFYLMEGSDLVQVPTNVPTPDQVAAQDQLDVVTRLSGDMYTPYMGAVSYHGPVSKK